MVRRVTTQGLPVEVVVGRAGTGKTYAMAAVRALYTAAGYQLVGVAPSALAARGLGEGAGMPAFTIPRFLRRAAPDLTARHVVVVDEAGMVGTVDLHRIVTAARTAGAKVILVGDHHQLPEIAAGGGFAAAVDAAAGYIAELTINRRQTEQWEIDALDQLRHGHVPTAFHAYQDHGRVVLHDRLEDVHAAAIGDWWHVLPARPQRPAARRHPRRSPRPQPRRPGPRRRRRPPPRPRPRGRRPPVPSRRPGHPHPQRRPRPDPTTAPLVPGRQRDDRHHRRSRPDDR